MIKSKSCSIINFRALLLNCIMLIPGVSSMKSFASASFPAPSEYLLKSSSLILPILKFHKLTMICCASILSMTWTAGISNENIATVFFPCTAICLAMSKLNADLPTDGLAARIIKSEFCNPPKILSTAFNPVANPLNPSGFFAISSALFICISNKVAESRKSVFAVSFEILSTFFSIESMTSSISFVASLDNFSSSPL